MAKRKRPRHVDAGEAAKLTDGPVVLKPGQGIAVKSWFAPGMTREVVPDPDGGYPTLIYRMENLPEPPEGPKE